MNIKKKRKIICIYFSRTYIVTLRLVRVRWWDFLVFAETFCSELIVFSPPWLLASRIFKQVLESSRNLFILVPEATAWIRETANYKPAKSEGWLYTEQATRLCQSYLLCCTACWDNEEVADRWTLQMVMDLGWKNSVTNPVCVQVQSPRYGRFSNVHRLSGICGWLRDSQYVKQYFVGGRETDE